MSNYNFFEEDFPAIDWLDITPHDSNNITDGSGNEIIPRSIYVGGAGDLTIVSKEGNTVTLTSVPAGTVLPIQPIRVNSTNTTATNIVGFI